LSADNLEIVGFNGAPLVECGRALPIVRRKADNAYAVLDVRDCLMAGNWHSENEAELFASKGQWTRLDKPLPVARSCCDTDGKRIVVQPMIVYADDSLLDAADRPARPALQSGEYLIWRKLHGFSEHIHAACASAPAIETLLNRWGRGLLERFDAMYRTGERRDYLKRIADFALCASREPSTRWKAFLYYATVHEPERVQRMFDTFVKLEFPDADWDRFIKALAALRDVLGSAPRIAPAPGPASSPPSAALSKVRGIAAESLVSEEALCGR
jgi:hypothetical protein